MDLNDIAPAVMAMLVIGILIGIGVVVLDEFGSAVKDDTSVVNETLTTASGTGTLTNDDLTSLSAFKFENDTAVYINGNVSTATNVNVTTAGVVKTSLSDGKYNTSYTYEADSEATTALFGTRDATDDFVTWLPVIIIILAAAIILGLVMRSFKQ